MHWRFSLEMVKKISDDNRTPEDPLSVEPEEGQMRMDSKTL